MVGKSAAMQKVYRLIEALTDLPSTVLISGASGTGKELVADALHHEGNRRGRPFVKVNCAALSENLLESELFGHVKGAFTGALKDRVGRFETADGGSIFLDEIGDISPSLQVRLLRVLQEREFERVGDSGTVKVDVRVIAATNQDLKEKVREGIFRADLYYRLKVVHIAMPPLSERLEDLPLLVQYFIGQFNHKLGKAVSRLSDQAMDALACHSWPGNVRELEHVLEHAFVLCGGSTITLDELPGDLSEKAAPAPGGARQKTAPQGLLQALEKAGWNKSKAARLLGVDRRTVYRKMEEFGILEKP
jgi:transcriptional regulator with GAF, ATPase, and Fis domain